MEKLEKITNEEQSSFESRLGPILLDQRIEDLIIKYKLVKESPNNDFESYDDIYNTKFSETEQKQSSIGLIKSSKSNFHPSSTSFYSEDGSIRLSDHWESNKGKMKTNFDYKYGEIVLAKLNYETNLWEKIESISAYRVEPWREAEQNRFLVKDLEKTFEFLRLKFPVEGSALTPQEDEKVRNILSIEKSSLGVLKQVALKIEHGFIFYRKLLQDVDLRKEEELEGNCFSNNFLSYIENISSELEKHYQVSLEVLLSKLKAEDLYEKRKSWD